MRLLVSFLLSVLFISSLLGQTRADSIRQLILSKDTQSILVVAHRGHWRHTTENSLSGIKHAIKIGVDIVEVDIQRTKDGHLVLMHDETLERTTTGEGRVDAIYLDSLRRLYLKNGNGTKMTERIPTLEEVLINTKGQVIFNLDKADRYIDDIYKLLNKTGTSYYVIMKTDKPFVDVRVQFHEHLFTSIMMPIINLDLSYAESDLDAYLSFLKPRIIELVYSEESNDMPFRIKGKTKGKSLLWYNTMWNMLSGERNDDNALNNPDEVYGYLIDSLGANIIQTDRPAYLLNYLRKRGLHQ